MGTKILIHRAPCDCEGEQAHLPCAKSQIQRTAIKDQSEASQRVLYPHGDCIRSCAINGLDGLL